MDHFHFLRLEARVKFDGLFVNVNIIIGFVWLVWCFLFFFQMTWGPDAVIGIGQDQDIY